MKKQFLDSGKIVGTHGIKGEVRIEPWCDSPAFLSAFKKLYLDENGATFIEVKSRPHKNITLSKIKGVDTIEDAERYRGKIVYINRDDIRLDEGVHFVQDLLGLEIRDADNSAVYGTLTDVLRTGANDVYEITDGSGKTYLAPVIDEVVTEINVDGGYVLLRPASSAGRRRAARSKYIPTSCATLPLTSTAASTTRPTAEEWVC